MSVCFFSLFIFYLLGSGATSAGEPVGKGLTETAAAELGLWEGMPVGTSLIDAHAGGLGKSDCQIINGVEQQLLTLTFFCNKGVIGADLSSFLGENTPLTSRLAVICGTSTCHMAVSNANICWLHCGCLPAIIFWS